MIVLHRCFFILIAPVFNFSVENIFKDIKTSGSGEVKIMIDPCLGKISHSFLNKQFNDVTAKMFVTDHIWPAIDEIFNKTGN